MSPARPPGNHAPTINPAAQPAQGGLDARGGGNLPGRTVTGSGGRIRRPAMAPAEFLLARIAEDEAVARDALHLDAVKPGVWVAEHHNSEYHSEPNRAHIAEDRSGHYWSVAHEVFIPIAEHIARHDPARVLAKCAADRRILAILTNGGQLSWERMAAANREILLDLVSAYEGHRDYRDEWRSES